MGSREGIKTCTDSDSCSFSMPLQEKQKKRRKREDDREQRDRFSLLVLSTYWTDVGGKDDLREYRGAASSSILWMFDENPGGASDRLTQRRVCVCTSLHVCLQEECACCDLWVSLCRRVCLYAKIFECGTGQSYFDPLSLYTSSYCHNLEYRRGNRHPSHPAPAFHRVVVLPLDTMLLSEFDRDCSLITG